MSLPVITAVKHAPDLINIDNIRFGLGTRRVLVANSLQDIYIVFSTLLDAVSQDNTMRGCITHNTFKNREIT